MEAVSIRRKNSMLKWWHLWLMFPNFIQTIHKYCSKKKSEILDFNGFLISKISGFETKLIYFYRQVETSGGEKLYRFSKGNKRCVNRRADSGWMEQNRLETYGHDSRHQVCYQQFDHLSLFFSFNSHLLTFFFIFLCSDLMLMVWYRLLSWIAKSTDLWTSLGASKSLLVPLEPQWLENVCWLLLS